MTIPVWLFVLIVLACLAIGATIGTVVFLLACQTAFKL
jgi:hypothetical protein